MFFPQIVSSFPFSIIVCGWMDALLFLKLKLISYLYYEVSDRWNESAQIAFTTNNFIDMVWIHWTGPTWWTHTILLDNFFYGEIDPIYWIPSSQTLRTTTTLYNLYFHSKTNSWFIYIVSNYYWNTRILVYWNWKY